MSTAGDNHPSPGGDAGPIGDEPEGEGERQEREPGEGTDAGGDSGADGGGDGDAAVELQRQLDCMGGCPIGSLAAELAESPRPRELLAGCFEEWESYLVAGFTAMRDRAELKAGAEPADLATAVMTAVQGGLLLTQTTRTTRPLELAIDMALNHVAANLR